MPAYNECSMYDEGCRDGVCGHPEARKNTGQCRTMPNQRPCKGACSRPECQREAPQATECVHGYMGTWGTHPARVVPCRDIEECPAFDAADFSADDLRLIMAMCKSANPWFPEHPMYPAWSTVYTRAESQLINRHPEE